LIKRKIEQSTEKKYDLKLIEKKYINIKFKYILVVRIVFSSYKFFFLFLNLNLIFILFDFLPLLIDYTYMTIVLFNLLGYEYWSSLFHRFLFYFFLSYYILTCWKWVLEFKVIISEMLNFYEKHVSLYKNKLIN